jgi:hypothetical protein
MTDAQQLFIYEENVTKSGQQVKLRVWWGKGVREVANCAILPNECISKPRRKQGSCKVTAEITASITRMYFRLC